MGSRRRGRSAAGGTPEPTGKATLGFELEDLHRPRTRVAGIKDLFFRVPCDAGHQALKLVLIPRSLARDGPGLAFLGDEPDGVDAGRQEGAFIPLVETHAIEAAVPGDAHGPHEVPLWCEDDDPLVLAVGQRDQSARSHRDIGRLGELQGVEAADDLDRVPVRRDVVEPAVSRVDDVEASDLTNPLAATATSEGSENCRGSRPPMILIGFPSAEMWWSLLFPVSTT